MISRILVFFLANVAVAAKMDPTEVMKKNDDAKRIPQMQAAGDIETRTGGDASTLKSKRFTWWRKLDADKIHYKLLTRFHFPPEIKNEGILFLDGANGEREVMLYLPNFKKIRRVESAAQSGSFMGSEFSYTDIMGYAVSDFTYKWVKEEPCGSVSCYVIESIPANDSARSRSDYAKRIDWVRADNFVVMATDYFDAKGGLVKKLKASQLTEVDKVNHKWMALELTMENLVNKKVTTIKFSDVKTTDIKDETFTPRNLEKVL